MKTITRRLRLTALLLLMTTLAACAAPTPTLLPPAPSQPAPAETASPSPSPVPSTATPTKAPTPTATIPPSPTPPGYYRHSGAGFAVTFPASWSVAEETSTLLAVVDPGSGMSLIASSRFEKEGKSLTHVKSDVLADLDPALQASLLDAKSTAVGSGNGHILQLEVTARGQRMVLWFYYVHFGSREYNFAWFGTQNLLNSRAETIQRVMSSVEMFDPQPFGLEKNQTLVQLGGDPLPESLDPAVTVTSAADYVGLLFSGLVSLSPDLQIQPDLAESWQISADGLVYTFTLRPGIKFASGEAITAEHFKESWERAADPQTKSSTAATYLGDIVGLKDKLAGKASEIAGVKVIDARTLQVTLDGPKPYFLAKLSYPTSFVVHPSDPRLSPDNWMYSPDASGPYKVKDYQQNDALIFERNPNYHTPAKTPYLVYTFNPGGAPVSLFEAGDLDVLPLTGEEAARVRDEKDPLHTSWQSAPMLCTSLLLLDAAKPPLDDANVRRALALSVDRDRLIEQLSLGQSLAASSILPPAMPGYLTGRDASSFDPQAAKAALEQSAYAGQSLTLTLNASGSGQGDRKDVSILAETWQKALGIKVEVVYLDPEEYTRSARQSHGHIITYSWCADYPDPENFLDVIFHSGSEYNVSGLKDASVDNLLEKARIEPDPAARIQFYQEAEAYLLQNNFAIPLSHPVASVLVAARVKGYTVTPLHARQLPQVWLETQP